MKHFRRWRLIAILKEGFVAFVDDNALSRGAAIAFYAVIAIAPVLFVATAIAALVLGPKAASAAVHYQLLKMMSAQSADLVQNAIVHVRGVHHSIQGSLIGLLALIVTTSGVFTEMEDALNVIWKAPRHESYLFQLLRGRVLSLGLVVLLGFLFMVSLVVASGVGLLGRLLNYDTVHSPFVSDVINPGMSFVMISLLFSLIYKVMPNTPLYWRDVILGAMGTALLFLAGQALISIYVSRFLVANIYGAAGGVIVLLVWGYYSAQIFLLGAEFTKVFAHHYGSHKRRD
ncbi:MAG TPA: YihY/virulence factor BrkB family protein [Rhizomicrobium sp.]|jgi:membrane protein|nr:YihY/virulence factor BrkB family protein [Rhizomicrobium sp.]